MAQSDLIESKPSNVRIFLDAEEATPDMIREFLWRVVDLIREIMRSLRRVSVLSLVIIIVFELVRRSLVEELSFGGLKLSTTGFVGTLAPVAVSYLYLRFTSLIRDLTVYTYILYETTSARFPGLYESDLDRTLPYIGGPTVSILPTRYSPYLRRMSVGAAFLELAMYHLIPLTFLIYAFSTLFSSLGGKNPLVWVGLVLSVIFVIFAIGYAAMVVLISQSPSGERDMRQWLSVLPSRVTDWYFSLGRSTK